MMSETKTMNMIEAINNALDIMLERDRDVVLMGEDIGYFGRRFPCDRWPAITDCP